MDLGFGLGFSLGGFGIAAFCLPLPFLFPSALAFASGPGSKSGIFFGFLCLLPLAFGSAPSSTPRANTSWPTGGLDPEFAVPADSGGSGGHRSSSSSTLAPRQSMNAGLSLADMRVP